MIKPTEAEIQAAREWLIEVQGIEPYLASLVATYGLKQREEERKRCAEIARNAHVDHLSRHVTMREIAERVTEKLHVTTFSTPIKKVDIASVVEAVLREELSGLLDAAIKSREPFVGDAGDLDEELSKWK